MKDSVGWFHLVILFVGIGCLVYWGNGNHLAVEVPMADSSLIQQWAAEKVSLQKRIHELTIENKDKDVKLKSIKYVIAQYERQLKEVQASVSLLPVIEASIHKEASTENGFRAAVARNFGKDIAAHIQITGGE